MISSVNKTVKVITYKDECVYATWKKFVQNATAEWDHIT